MLGIEPLTIPQDHLGKWDWRVLKFVKSFAVLAVNSEFRQFGKMSAE